MFGRISNIRLKRRGWFFAAFCFFTLLLAPTAAHAIIHERIAEAIARLIIDAIAFFPALFFFLISAITNWFIQLVMDMGVTPGASGTPSFVTAGWNFTRGFSNMFFLLILVFIGLATILRIQNYQLQRTLPRLIIIALLVNFSGLLVGFVVDIANLLANFFLSEITAFGSGGFSSVFDRGQDIVNGMKASPDFSWWQKLVQGLAIGFALAFFFIFASLVFFVIFLIFFLRQVILWAMVILAPIAFAAYILPISQGWWRRWLDSVLQWSFVALPIAFFMWLANNIMTLPVTDLTGGSDPGGLGGIDAGPGLSWAGELIALMLVPFTGIVFLMIGMTLALSMAPTAARRVAIFGAGVGVAAGLGAGYLAWRKSSQSVERFGENMRKRGHGLEVKEEEKTRMERFAASTLGKVPGAARLGESKIGKFAARTGGGVISTSSKKLSSVVGIRDDQQIAKAQREAAQMRDPQDIINQMKIDLNPKNLNQVNSMNRAIGRMKELVENGDPFDIERAFQSGDLNPNILRKIYKGTKERRDPEYRRLMEKAFISRHKEMGVSEKDSEDIWRRITPGDIQRNIVPMENFDVRTERGRKATDDLLKNADPDVFPAVVRAFQRPERRKQFRDYLEQKDNQWYVDNDLQNVPMYFTSMAAQNEGLASLHGETREDIQRRIDARTAKPTSQLNTENARLELEEKQLIEEEKQNLEAQLQRLQSRATLTPAQTDRRDNIADDLNEIQAGTFRLREGRGRQVQNRLGKIAEELTFRDETQNPTGNLQAEHGQLSRDIEQIDAIPENNRTAAQYKERAEKEKRGSTVKNELDRRAREVGGAETGITGIPEKTPLAEQMANIEKRIGELQNVTVGAAPGTKRAEKAEIKRLKKEFDKLDAALASEPPPLQRAERALYQTKTDILRAQRGIDQLTKRIEIEKQTTNDQARVRLLETQLGQAKNTLSALERQQETQLEDRELRRITKDTFTPQGLAEQAAHLEAEEKKFAAQAAKLKVAQDTPENIAAEEAKAKIARTRKDHAVRKLTAMIHKQNLTQQNTGMQTQSAALQSEINRIQQQLPTAQTAREVDRLQAQLREVRQQRTDAQTKIQENQTELNRILTMEGDPLSPTLPINDPGRQGIADAIASGLTAAQRNQIKEYQKAIKAWQKGTSGKQMQDMLEKQKGGIKVKPIEGQDNE